MEQERRHSGRFAESFDTADEDGVVAAGMGGFVGDFETGAAARQQRYTGAVSYTHLTLPTNREV